MPKDDWIKHNSKSQYDKEESKSGRVIMPWGKYKGRNFDQIPRWYLEWLIKSDYCKEEWKGEIICLFDKWNDRITLKEMPRF